MRVEDDSISADVDEDEIDALEPDFEPGSSAPTTAGGAETPSATADKFARIIEDAQSSTREFLDTVRRQSQSILEEAEEEAQRHRAELIEQAQDRLNTLIGTTDEMLRDAERLQSDLESVSESLRASAGKLRTQVDQLVGSDDTGSGGNFGAADDDEEIEEDDAQYAPPNRRRFGLR